MYQAASRLSDTMFKSYFTYSERGRDYHINSSIPSAMSKCISSWEMAYSYFLGSANKAYKSWLQPPEVKEYIRKSAMYRIEATNEMNKLFERLKLSDVGRTDLHSEAANIVASEKWYPYL